MQLTGTQTALIKAFVADFGGCLIRDAKLARELRQTELRTKKHSFLAVCWDELGNAFVLTRSGQRRQLIGDETKAVRV